MQKDEPAETAVVLRFSTVKVSGLSSASHGSHAEHLERLNRFTGIRDELGAAVATILDTKGPEIRVRAFAEPVELKAGDEFTLASESTIDVTNTRNAVLPTGINTGAAAATALFTMLSGLIFTLLCKQKKRKTE